MKKMNQSLSAIGGLDEEAMKLAKERQDQLTKPQGSLGVLEKLSIKVAGIMGNPMPKIAGKVIIVMAGDHGVVEEGVSAFPQEVTSQMVYNFIHGGAGINVIANHVGAKVRVVDMGVARPISNRDVLTKKVKSGTANMVKGPAMSREEVMAAIESGIEVAEEEIRKGANIVGTGDMGIGNTTSSSAILAAFIGPPVEELVGRGTGIENGQLKHKAEVIKRTLETNRPDPEDALDVLSKVGGLEIAGIVGCIIGAAANHTPVVIDGFISGAAALVASKMSPKLVNYMIASHISVEPGHQILLGHLGLEPMLHMDMRLGEGTGAALGISLVEVACKVLSDMATFSEARVSGAVTE